jgi:purine-binding chemotaxis protein CheW
VSTAGPHPVAPVSGDAPRGPAPDAGASARRDEDALLRARARALAQPVQAPHDDAQTIEVLEFALAQERYAVETRHVREVLPLRQLTPLPCTPSFVQGIVNVRGQMVPVLDLKEFLGLPQGGLTDLHRVLLVGDETRSFGILADIGVGVQRLPLASLQSSLPLLGGMGADYILAVTPDHLVVLDVPRILSDPRILVDESPHAEGD